MDNLKFGPKFGPKICADKLGRGLEGVKSKFYKLNIPISGGNVSKEEIEALIFTSTYINLAIEFTNHQNPKELAYWLGFFWADGYIRKDSELVIEITEEDGIVLEPIFKRLASFKIYKRIREGRKPQMSFYYRDKNIAQILKSLGKYSNSIESHEKILQYIPEKYRNYFIRGLIDGDGNFYINTKDKYAQFTLASNVDQDWGFLQEFLKNFHPHIHISEKESSKSSVLRITGKDNILNFIKYLKYETDSIGLTRKIEKVKNIIHLYN